MNNRELKFKVWLLGTCEMLIGVYTIPELMRQFRKQDVLDNGQIFLQYTGLKDLNGNEIYEGDIIKKTYGSSVPFFVVAWHNERAMFIQQDGYNEPLFQIETGYIEIIGNIYEHPNLIQS
jgi:uncharacterized phage protein (TIGR01671 family)